ncbi:MAG: hypothetical protein ACR2MM_08515 [Flavobacteriaceae bacterium]
MEIERIKKTIVLLALSILLSNCIDLKSVNNYASTSLKGIEKYEEIDYSFMEHCLDRCEYELVKKNIIEREVKCDDCGIFKEADKATNIIYRRIRGYFDALESLTNNELTDYDFDDLSNALKKGDFEGIQIEDEEVNAAAKIGNIILRASTDIYRKNKVKVYVGEANTDIQILLKKFQEIIDANLAELLSFKSDDIHGYYRRVVLDTMNSNFIKGRATYLYYQELSEIRKRQKKIRAYAKSINKIAKGHQELYDNRNNMTQKEFKTLISGYAGDIKNIVSEFNKLKE